VKNLFKQNKFIARKLPSYLLQGTLRSLLLLVCGLVHQASAQSNAQSASSAEATSASTAATANKAMAAVKAANTAEATDKQKATADDSDITRAKSRSGPKSSTLVGYNRNIKQEQFAGLSKVVVLNMQKQLELIYKDIPEWKYDYSLKHHPLNDGIVGPITLSWLQRYTYNFKIEAVGDYAKTLPNNIERIANFGTTKPNELIILLSTEFEDWQNALSEKSRLSDYKIRKSGSDKELSELVARYLASRKIRANQKNPRRFDDSAYYRYSLDQTDLELLAGKDQVVQSLDALKDKEFPSLESLRVAAGHALAGRDYLLKQVWPIIERQVGEFDGYEINDAVLATLKKQKAPSALLDELSNRGHAYFKNKDDFDAFLEELLVNLAPDTSSFFPQVYEAARVFDNVHLTEQSLLNIKNELKGNIRNAGVPIPIVTALKAIQDVDYPEASIFHSAAFAKVMYAVGACRANLVRGNQFIATLRTSDNDFALFKKEIEVLRVGGNFNREFAADNLAKVFDTIIAYRAKIDLCEADELKEAKRLVQGIYDEFLAGIIEDTARKKMADTIIPVQIAGADCGCALDDLSGVVYGFYPYWNAPKTVQSINFRTLNRTAFLGLTVDNVGELHLGNSLFDLTNGNNASDQAIRVARQHNSKVDWLIQKNDWGGDWKNFSRENKQAIFKKLIVSISTLLRSPLNDPMSQTKHYLSLGLKNRPTRGDGVSLYFQNYPQDAGSTLVFNEFYHALRKELQHDNVFVNLVIAQNSIVGKNENRQGAFSLHNLVKLRKDSSLNERNSSTIVTNANGYILVLMEEPSTESKKRLRADIEGETTLRGDDRSHFLRSVVPVLNFDRRNWEQLHDDIVYAEDNFGGVGFWAPDFNNLAIPLVNTSQNCEDAKQMSLCLLLHFSVEDAVIKPASPIEKFVCVYRDFLHLAMTFCVLALIITFALWWTNCNAQNFIKRYFLWITALILIPPNFIFIMLLFYDPDLSALSKGNLPFIFAVGIIVGGIIAGYLYLRSQRRTPTRQRVVPQRVYLGAPLLLWTIRNTEDFQWIIRNDGESLGVINKIDIFLDGNPMQSLKALVHNLIGEHAQQDTPDWRETPLVGRALMPQDQILALSIADKKAAKLFKLKLRKHKLEVNITYCSASNEYWLSNGNEVSSIPKPD
jgi:hypothetical protein